jgi:formylglycine-generating enzyme required for sulfatase activity
MSDLINRILSNQFRVDAFIASGGMGAVYRVWDLKRNVPLAMKVLHADLAEDPSMFKRFEREANALKKLAHPNIVPFYGLYQTADFAFLLERYMDGPSLKDILRKQQGAPLPVHCDVKPGNVMIDKGGNIYLTDFGIARHSDSTTTTLATIGTAAYMAPEQIRGEPVSPETDIYALGVMLFEMLTGQRPFKGDEKGTESGGSTANERIRYGHLHLSPCDPCLYNPALAPSLSKVILKALEKDPSLRFSSTGDLFATFCSAFGTSPTEVAERIRVDTTMVGSPSSDIVLISSGSAYPSILLNRLKLFLKSWPGWITSGILGVTLIITLMYLLNDASKDRLPFSTLNSPTETLMGSLPIAGLTKTPRPSITATLIPTSTTVPTVPQTPTPTCTPVEVQKAKDGAEMVFVPAGDFIMGSDSGLDPYFWGAEGPPHRVYLNSFWIYRTEVTNAMYQACAAEKACPRPEQIYSHTHDPYYGNPDYANYPVIYVSYIDATAYCLWVGGRLPTEAEWEKAARGSDERLFPWGDELPTGDRLNFCDWNCPESLKESSVDDSYKDTAPVGSYPAGSSPYGVFDMAGNVSEWTADWMAPLYYDVSPDKSPLGPDSGTRRVVRGGSWGNPTEGVRTVARFSVIPSETLESIGFRCVVVNPVQ